MGTERIVFEKKKIKNICGFLDLFFSGNCLSVTLEIRMSCVCYALLNFDAGPFTQKK